tara:strand:+ start:267 stop:629 length:363 start_codon:yes stop_codon:yes gene_type:complete
VSKIPTLRKIQDADLKELVAQAAKKDNDNMQFPSHVVLKDGEIVGGWQIAQMPLVLAWHHTKKVNAKDSMIINSTVESMMSTTGINQWFMACNDHSPFMGHMEKFGFNPIWPTNIFHKEI